MLHLKKISPIEFRIQHKAFLVPLSPLNYFTYLRFQFIIEQLFFWFYSIYGYFFFLKKITKFPNFYLYQIFYYKTFNYNQKKTFLKKNFNIFNWQEQNLNKTSLFFFNFFFLKKKSNKLNLFTKFCKKNKIVTQNFPLLVKNLTKKRLFRNYVTDKVKKKRNKKIFFLKFFLFLKRKNQFLPFYSKFAKLNTMFLQQFFTFFLNNCNNQQQISIKPKFVQNLVIVKKKNFSLNLLYSFLSYFLFMYFKFPNKILFKSLFKFFLQNKILKDELNIFYKKAWFTQRFKWSFDFFFFLHFGLTFFNVSFAFPFFITHLITLYQHMSVINIVLDAFKIIFVLKKNLSGIKVLIRGKFNRHGRTRSYLFKIGKCMLMEREQIILYDILQFTTFYGVVNFKVWFFYNLQG